MQFALLVTFAAAAMALTIPQNKRQSTQPTVQVPSMTTADGTIVDFDAANVYLDSMAKGL